MFNHFSVCYKPSSITKSLFVSFDFLNDPEPSTHSLWDKSSCHLIVPGP